MLLRFLGLHNYLILGSGLNGLSGRIMVMRFPTNVNFLHFARGGSVPLPWTPTDAEPGSYCSDWSHMVWEMFFFINTGSRVGDHRALTRITPSYLFIFLSEHTLKLTFSLLYGPMSINACIGLCHHHRNQDTGQLHHSKNLLHVPLRSHTLPSSPAPGNSWSVPITIVLSSPECHISGLIENSILEPGFFHSAQCL